MNKAFYISIALSLLTVTSVADRSYAMPSGAKIARSLERASTHTFQIEATECRNAPKARTLTGFLLDKVGIVTAAHGVIGCKVSAKPARGSRPNDTTAVIEKVFLDRDLAVLKWTKAPLPSDGLPFFDSADPGNANLFMACGYFAYYVGYHCYTVENLLPGSTAKLSVTLTAVGNDLLKVFQDRKSPDPDTLVYRIGPWDYLGPGLSGAAVMDRYSGAVIALIDGGTALSDPSAGGRHTAWAIPIDVATMSHPSWIAYPPAYPRPSLTQKARITKLATDELPRELTTSDKSAPQDTRPMKPAELALFRDTASLFAQGLLETYPCQWMLVGAELMNTLCGSMPCSKTQIDNQLYTTKINDFDSEQTQKVCSAIANRIRGFSAKANESTGATALPSVGTNAIILPCDPAKADYWFADFGPQNFSDILRPIGIGIVAQTALIYNILWLQVPPDKRDTLLQQVLDEWENGRYTPNTSFFESASQKFETLRQACEPGGCELGVGGAFNTKSGWAVVSRVLFERWFDYYGQLHPGPPGAYFKAGCAGARIAKDASGYWQYLTGRSCNPGERDCYSFGGPFGTSTAARRFVETLRFERPQLDLTLTSDLSEVTPSGQVIVMTLIKNQGNRDAGLFHIVFPLPSCVEVVSQSPMGDIDTISRTASWTFDSLPGGGIDVLTLAAKVSTCSDSTKLQFSPIVRTEDDAWSPANPLSISVKASASSL